MTACRSPVGGSHHHRHCFPSFCSRWKIGATGDGKIRSLPATIPEPQLLQAGLGVPGQAALGPLFFFLPFFMQHSYFCLKLRSQDLLKNPRQRPSLGRKWGSCEAGELGWGVKGVGGHSGNRGPEKPHTEGTWKGPHAVAPAPASMSPLGAPLGLCLILPSFLP